MLKILTNKRQLVTKCNSNKGFRGMRRVVARFNFCVT